MALGINFGTGAVGDGDTLFAAFTKINNMFTTTTKLSNGDLTINDVKVGKGAGSGNYASTAIGQDTLANATTGSQNVAIGLNALYSNTSGTYNVAVGVSSQRDGQTVGANVSLGNYSLYKNYGGQQNVAVGYSALENNLTGGNNTAVGHEALSSNTAFFNITGIGYNAQVTGSDQIQLGSGSTTCYTNGALQNRSDERDKTEVRDTVLGLDFINELRPVDYKWDMREDYKSEMPSRLNEDATEEEKEAHQILMNEWLESVKMDNLNHDGTHTRTRYHHGLIAQEVQDVIQASGVDFGGFQDHSVNGGQDVLSLGYTELIAPMIKAIQELTARINVLEGN